MKKKFLIVASIAIGVLLTLRMPFGQWQQQAKIHDLVHDEEIVLELVPLTNAIAKALKDRCLINDETREIFADSISLVDILPDPDSSIPSGTDYGVRQTQWLVGANESQRPDSIESTSIWNALFHEVSEITVASFGYVAALSESQSTFNTLLKFSGKGTNQNQHPVSFEGSVNVGWVKQEGAWKIAKWHTNALSATCRKGLLFRNRMPELFAAGDLELATRSLHEEKVVEYISKGSVRLPRRSHSPYFQPESGYQHPAVSVVDINQDGWDDLFVTSLWGKCQLWVNEEGRKFSERSSAYGLDVDFCCTCAIFSDLDNDGDDDLVLGRSLERSQIFWNEDGQFVASADVLPYLVTSVSVADCNNDGLLDFYLCTYGPNGTAAQMNSQWIEQFVPHKSRSKLREALSNSHRYYNQAGPANYLMINRGGRVFESAPADDLVDQFHNTYQASWADFDQDGDVDVYLCNDFAPDSLLRNEGSDESGIPRFTDASSDTMKGFGMGASWGDYDNDQQMDLFVTAMYSKAGKRVLSRFEGIDDRLHFSARGNLLFNQQAGKFQQLAGEGDEFFVNQGGWAFGGQFIDVDNDSWLDLYVPNGFYTAPQDVASEVDL
ncbi:MAG: hypothetical protein ACI87E_002337 [Mariniblastus sp.]|jgi:hypothetical protein